MHISRYRPLLSFLYHATTWVLLFLLIGFVRRSDNPHPLTTLQVFIIFMPSIVLFYVNAFWLMPGYFDPRRRKWTIVLAVACLAAAVLLSGVLFYYLHPLPVRQQRMVSNRAWPALFCLAVSFGFGAVRESVRLDERRKERENENLRTELSFLRSQVNPHFMLNVINSIVAAARIKPEKVEPALIELASLMSYMLYNNTGEKVMLSEEIGYLETYINLQMLRFGDDVELDFERKQEGGDTLIEPMLLIPLVENAFKHGIGLVARPVIRIQIHTSVNNELTMRVTNTYNEAALLSEDKYAGIGLANLKKRLQLIYPGKSRLDIIKSDNHFIASLNLQLS